MKTKLLFPALLLAATGVFASESRTRQVTTKTTTTITTTTQTVTERKTPARKSDAARSWFWGRSSGALCDSAACRPLRFAWSPTAPGS